MCLNRNSDVEYRSIYDSNFCVIFLSLFIYIVYRTIVRVSIIGESS